MDLAAAVQEVVDQLVAGGVRATVDQRDLNPPAVLVDAPAIAWRFGKGGWNATWTATVVVPDTGNAQALTDLSVLLEQVQAALGGIVAEGRPADLLTQDAGILPGYRLTWSTHIR